MSAKSSQGGSSVQSELRVVILGDDKNKVVKFVLDCENLTGVKVGLCMLHQRDRGRRISVVEAPGWDRSSKQQTPEDIREEVKRSVSLFPPGPHALLLVIPVKSLSEEPSTHDITAAQTHMESLSERVWKHTILLFACDEGVEDPQITEYIRSAEKILEKCGRRYYVLQKRSQSNKLLIMIDDLVKENHGDIFIQSELIKHMPHEASGEDKLRKRRGSLDNPPSLNKDKEDYVEKKETIESDKPLEDIGLPKSIVEIKKFVLIIALILMGVVGALIGAVVGAESGVSGSATGLVCGIIVGLILACITMCIYTRVYSNSYPKKARLSRVNSG